MSSRAHVVLPWHSLLDGAAEARLSDRGEAIGTTRGVSGRHTPTRLAIHGRPNGRSLDAAYLKAHLDKIAPTASELKVAGNDTVLDTKELLTELTRLGERLAAVHHRHNMALHDRLNRTGHCCSRGERLPSRC